MDESLMSEIRCWLVTDARAEEMIDSESESMTELSKERVVSLKFR